MATEPINTSGGTMPSFDTQRSAADAKHTQEGPQSQAIERPVARAKSKPPIDRVEVSTVARTLIKVVTDPQLRLQLSPRQLKEMSTGREGDT